MQLFLQLLPFLALLPSEAVAQYKESWKYKGSESIGKYFKYATLKDPSGGFVNYVDEKTAHQQGMIKQMKNSVRVGPDSKGKFDWTARNRTSVRLESHKNFGPGLLIADFEHIPVGACGSWPAFWMLGQGSQPWPAEGEIDIIEGVNHQPANQMTLHTTDGCSISDKGYKGIPPPSYAQSCISGQGQPGCFIKARNKDTYGAGFNQGNGGVYAMQWTDKGIAIWNFPRKQIPANIKNNSPDPSKWGKPVALFHGACNIKDHFKNMYLIMNIDFCGPWAEGGDTAYGCPVTGESTCRAYVANNPGAYKNSYFEVNHITYYTRKASHNAAADDFAAYSEEAPAPALPNETYPGYVGGMGGYSSPPATRRSFTPDYDETEIEERDAELEDDVEAELEE